MKKILILFISILLFGCSKDETKVPDNSIKQEIDNFEYIMPIISSDAAKVEAYLKGIYENVLSTQEGNNLIIDVTLPDSNENLFSHFHYVFYDMGVSEINFTYKFNKTKVISPEIQKIVTDYLNKTIINL